MMKIGRLGHASVIVETAEVMCLMDPVLRDTFDCGLIAFEPPVRIDVDALRGECNLIVISHEHADHFDIPSLALFDRDTVIYFPAGASLIERALRRLGFDQIRAIAPGEDIGLADLRIIPTPSHAEFPEIGVIFECGGTRCWNLVDTQISEATIAFAKQAVTAIDVLLASHQPLIQRELCVDGLGSSFPVEAYGAFLRNVLDIAPRCVIPASCGFRYAEEDWLNDRGFPIDAAQFLADLRAVEPALRGVILEPGARLVIADEACPTGEFRIEAGGFPFVRRDERKTATLCEWRPDRGVPPLADRNPLGRDPVRLAEEVRDFLDGDFLAQLGRAQHAAWRARMARLQAWWRLEVVHPGGEIDVRWLDLSSPRLAWSRSARCLPKIHTSITASVIAGLLTGEFHEDRLSLGNMRVFTRLYQVHRGGAVRSGGDGDEPLSRVLVPGARERFVEQALRSLGV